ncbi:hypothetical protein GA0074695_2933 [Micromonospora viridifaciens]|uniref:Uncharacterized protein n=1 Tax=Micromonospora viridifaciens TaxID=1881 RepID=A0A1C4X1Q7_MICVI|nr:hypothetical protein [Micromonospora viridifaciens]SCF02405.1 hypothetical protein GA0074695_2933 [Micromonospora viridifaciens]
MWLILCDPSDHAALWAFTGLHVRGLSPLELVCAQELACATFSAHRIGRHNSMFEIHLPDGRTLLSTEIQGVLNRLSHVPTDHLAFASEPDARYAADELTALVLSWIACVGAVTVNRPSPRGLAGAWRSPAEWNVLAARSGLPVPRMPLSTLIRQAPELPTATRSVIVLGEFVFGDGVPTDIARACVRLARSVDADLLGLQLHLDHELRARFAGATYLPDLRLGGQGLLDELHRHLTRPRVGLL